MNNVGIHQKGLIFIPLLWYTTKVKKITHEYSKDGAGYPVLAEVKHAEENNQKGEKT